MFTYSEVDEKGLSYVVDSTKSPSIRVRRTYENTVEKDVVEIVSARFYVFQIMYYGKRIHMSGGP